MPLAQARSPHCDSPTNEGLSTQMQSHDSQEVLKDAQSVHPLSSSVDPTLASFQSSPSRQDPTSLHTRESYVRTQSSASDPTRQTSPKTENDLTLRPPSMTVAFPTATYVSPGLRSASQLASDAPPLYVAYRPPNTRSVSSPDVPQIAPSPVAGPSMLVRSSTAPGGYSTSLTPGPAFINVRGGSTEEEWLSSEHDDDKSQDSTSSPSASHQGPWDEFVQSHGTQFMCVWKTNGSPCRQIGHKRHLVTRHIKAVHLKIRPFWCRYCPKTFANNSNLEAHENTHTGKTPYDCPFCQKGFSDRAGLHRHKIKDHDYQPKSKRTQAVFVSPTIHPSQ